MTPELDALLRSALTREAEHAMTLTDVPAAHDRLRDRLDTQRRNRRLLVGAGIAASLVVAAGGYALIGDDRAARLEPQPPATAPPQAPAETALDTASALPNAAVAVRGTAAAAPLRQNLAFAAGSLWSVATDGKALVRIDPATGRAAGTVSLGLPAGLVAEGVAAAGNRLVVTAAPPGHVVEGEPAHNAAYVVVDGARRARVAQVPTNLDFGQDGNRVATGPAGTWVQSGPQELGLLDTARGTISRRVDVGTALNGFAVGATTLWVASYEAGTTTRIDAATGGTVTFASGGGTINAAAIGDVGYVWTAASVVRVEGGTPAETARLRLGFANGGKADFAAVGDRLSCVCGVGGQLTLTDPALTRAVAYEVPGSNQETSITVGGNRVWLLLQGGTLLGIDPTSL